MTRILWRPEPDLKNFRSLTRKGFFFFFFFFVKSMVVTEGESRMWGCRRATPDLTLLKRPD